MFVVVCKALNAQILGRLRLSLGYLLSGLYYVGVKDILIGMNNFFCSASLKL